MRLRLPIVPLAFLLASALAAPASGAAPAAPVRLAPWTFHTDFHRGLAAWMSFPLPQDVGYDPTLYTAADGAAPVLVRDVIAHGEKQWRVGLIRALAFHAGPAAVLRLTYRLEACGGPTALALTLGADDGARYRVPLPATPGWHSVVVRGAQLHLPAAGAQVTTVVLEATIAVPVLGSHNRLALRSLEISAERPAAVPVLQPRLAASPGDAIGVARAVATPAAPLFLQLAGAASAHLTLYDSAGRLAREQAVPAAGAAIRLPPDAAPGLWRAVVERDGARSEFTFLVLAAAPPPHPRLLLTAARWRALRASPALVAQVHAAAAAAAAKVQWNPRVGDNIALMPAVSVFPGLPAYFSLLENYSHAIALNAIDYQLSGDAGALETARRGLLTVARWPTWTPTWFAAHGLHTYYEVGVFGQRLAFGYDLVADRLTPADKATIASAFWRLAIQPTVQEYFLDNRMPIAASNHMANSVGGALALAAALAGDVPGWQAQEAPALAELTLAYHRLLDGLFPGDGSEAEPIGYEDFAMEGMSWGAAALDGLDIHPAGLAAMKQAFWWPLYVADSPRLLLDTGDFGDTLTAYTGYAWSAAHSSDPHLRAFYDSALTGTIAALLQPSPPVRHTGRALEAAPGLLDLACCPAPAPPVETAAPLARIFAGRGSVAMRSGWQPGATIVSLRVGPWFNHHHVDEGTFQVAAGSETLVAEAGYADYYKEPLYASYFTQPAGHNTVLLDGDPFSQSGLDGRYWKAWQTFPRITAHAFAPGLDYLAADLAPAYAGRLQSYTRDYLFVAPDLLVVRDRLRAPAQHRYSWLLHPEPGDEVSLAGGRAAIRGHAVRATLVATSPQALWRLRPAPVSEGTLGDFTEPIPPHQVLSLLSAPAAQHQFLVGIQLGPAATQGDLETLSTAAGEGFRSRALGAAVLFRTGSGALAAAGFTTDGDLLALRSSPQASQLLATHMRQLRAPDGRSAAANQPVSLEWSSDSSADHLRLTAAATTDLRLALNRAPRQVTLDGAPLAAAPRANDVIVPHLAAGEHRLDVLF